MHRARSRASDIAASRPKGDAARTRGPESRTIETPQAYAGNQAMLRKMAATGSPGEELAQPERENLERAFRADLTGVRVHRDSAAAAVARSAGARAITQGSDIYFGPGAFGSATLSHEIAHVLQQSQATSWSPFEDAALEREAEAASSTVGIGRTPRLSRPAVAPALQRQPDPAAASPAAAPAGPAPAAAGPSTQSGLSFQTVTLDGFESGKSDLSKANTDKLDALAEQFKTTLSRGPDSFLNIVGFSDAPGAADKNKIAGQQRAQAVMDYLAAKGIPAKAMSIGSLGSEVMAVDTKKAEAKNRRVEVYIHERPASVPGTLGTPQLGQPSGPQTFPKLTLSDLTPDALRNKPPAQAPGPDPGSALDLNVPGVAGPAQAKKPSAPFPLSPGINYAWHVALKDPKNTSKDRALQISVGDSVVGQVSYNIDTKQTQILGGYQATQDLITKWIKVQSFEQALGGVSTSGQPSGGSFALVQPQAGIQASVGPVSAQASFSITAPTSGPVTGEGNLTFQFTIPMDPSTKPSKP